MRASCVWNGASWAGSNHGRVPTSLDFLHSQASLETRELERTAVGGAAATLQIQKSVLKDWNGEARAAWPRKSWKLAFQESVTTFSVTLRKTLWFGCRNSHPIKNHRVWKSLTWACWASYWTPAIPAFQRWLESITISRSAWVIQQVCG